MTAVVVGAQINHGQDLNVDGQRQKVILVMSLAYWLMCNLSNTITIKPWTILIDEQISFLNCGKCVHYDFLTRTPNALLLIYCQLMHVWAKNMHASYILGGA